MRGSLKVLRCELSGLICLVHKPILKLTKVGMHFTIKLELSFLDDEDPAYLVSLLEQTLVPLNFKLLQVVAEFEYRSVRPVLEARDAHHEVEHNIEPLSFYPSQRSLKIYLIKSSEMTFLQACHSGCSWLVGE